MGRSSRRRGCGDGKRGDRKIITRYQKGQGKEIERGEELEIIKGSGGVGNGGKGREHQ